MQNVIPNYTLWAQMIKEFEGFRSVAYQDSGSVWTCGFGYTYNFNTKAKVKQGDVITMTDAINWMQFEFQDVVRQANIYIKQPLNGGQATGICDYIYNRGIGNFLKTSLDELINANPNDSAIGVQIRGTGLKDRLGNVLRGLQRRRNSEAYMYNNGIFKANF